MLVVGAAGKTGRAVTSALAARDVQVRAALHSAARSGEAYAAGARSVAVVDLTTGSGLDEALVGVDAVYHLAPNVHPDEVGIARRVAKAAVRAGVERFAFHSVLHPDDTSMPHHLRKAEAEEVVRAVVPTATVLRPAAYHQNLLGAAMAGSMAVPYSLDAPFSNVDLGDLAEVAAEALTTAGHEGRTHELAGPEVLSVRDQAAVAAQVLGRRVEAIRIDIEAWSAGPGAGLDRQARADLLAMFASYDRSGLVGDPSVLADLLGRRPRTWADALRPS
ncbi:nmra family transcriptional regulator [Intrasporangium oryzae NRRL B-24470]|uniref:Nmra family transcriptional regulator n=1 Tax=Intrasporangium oryzae NRRL B-24470 TaxID=1386089 RepID=W9G9F3_9MICO|nr:nmra family transcriptional regulator [Intrasporangium oryzae NRRL B-24470]